jgi:hypothetical protein
MAAKDAVSIRAGSYYLQYIIIRKVFVTINEKHFYQKTPFQT